MRLYTIQMSILLWTKWYELSNIFLPLFNIYEHYILQYNRWGFLIMSQAEHHASKLKCCRKSTVFLNAWLMRMLSDCPTLQIAPAGVPSVTLRFQRLGNPLSIQCYLLVSDPSDLKSFCFINSLFKNYCKMLKISNMVFDSEFIY